jgi:uncharacterized protein YkwD
MGLDVSYAGENSALRLRTPQAVVDIWMSSTRGHLEFILSGLPGNAFGSNIIYIGVGFSHCENSGVRTAWTLWKSVEPR